MGVCASPVERPCVYYHDTRETPYLLLLSGTVFLRIFVVINNIFKKKVRYNLKYATTASFHIFSSSQFTVFFHYTLFPRKLSDIPCNDWHLILKSINICVFTCIVAKEENAWTWKSVEMTEEELEKLYNERRQNFTSSEIRSVVSMSVRLAGRGRSKKWIQNFGRNTWREGTTWETKGGWMWSVEGVEWIHLVQDMIHRPTAVGTSWTFRFHERRGISWHLQPLPVSRERVFVSCRRN
jgi:hypothetical protein